ncbi:hypothetical protein RF11_09883 [Thelohanellus kitauei]|uniref:Uncharacterized protein n=1 Tax=Thelohanellus kitauei TaxID=669202 RepID=A0A0C2MI41_THEKT|nr:hypothetical protein RF11_09883 [Thelohanellus kitauei]
MRCIRSKKNSEGQIFKHFFWYEFNLKQNTKYEIESVGIYINTYDNSVYIIKFQFYNLIITLLGYSRKYYIKKEIDVRFLGDLKSTTISDDLEKYGGTYCN